MAYFFQLLLNGTHTGSLYALLAYGYLITYQVTKRASFAHGALFAFTGQNLILFTAVGWHALWLVFPLALAFGVAAAAMFSFLALFLLARTVLPPLIERSPNTTIAVSLAVMICLTELARLAAGTKDYWLPPIFAEPVALAGALDLTLTRIQIFNIVIAVAALSAAEFALRAHGIGRNIRAVSDDPLAGELLGVCKAAVFRSAIFLGGAFAVAAGALAAVYYGNIGFGSGLVFGLKVLFIAAAGGFGSPIAAAAGAFSVGIFEALWDGYFPTIYRDVTLYVGLTLLLAAHSNYQETHTLR